MNSSSMTVIGFRAFYRDHFLPEHRHPLNVALHVLGTLASGGYAVWALWSPWPWLLLLYPVVHALPGLIGHRLVERNAAVGDVRVTRSDFPPLVVHCSQPCADLALLARAQALGLSYLIASAAMSKGWPM